MPIVRKLYDLRLICFRRNRFAAGNHRSQLRATRSRGKHFCSRDINLHRSPKEVEQHSNPFFGRQHLGDHDLQAAKRAFYDMNGLANLERGIDRDDLVASSV